MKKENILPDKSNAQIAVVTGAAGAFGQEIVKQLLAKGFVVAATDKSPDALNKMRHIVSSSEDMKTFPMDVADRQSVSDTAEQISSTFCQPISVLVNNAGIFRTNPVFMPESGDIAKEIFEINLIGVIHCVSVFGKSMVKNKFGRIVNIASAAGIMGSGGASAYAASKGGMIAATKSWARELGHFGITVNAVAPGICRTPMMEKEDSSLRIEKLMKPLIPVKRLGTPHDVAEAVVFFATCKSDYINGDVLTLDGGLYTGTIDQKNFIF